MDSCVRYGELSSFQIDFMCAKINQQLQVQGRMSEFWQLKIASFLEGCLFDRGRDRQPSLLKRLSHHKCVSVHYGDCVLLQLCKVWGGFYPFHPAHHGVFSCLGTSCKKKSKPKQKDAHNQHKHTQQDCAPLFCVFWNPDCGNYLSGFTSLFFHSKGSFWNHVTLNSV